MSEKYYGVYRITDVRDEAYNVRTLMFDKEFDAEPGQFVMAWLPGVSENPFSVSYENGITVKNAGDMTSRLCNRDIGDSVWIRGPYGTPFNYTTKGLKYLVAGGTGAIPLAFLAESLDRPTIFLGAKTKNELLFENRLKKSGNLYIATDDGSCGYRGIVTDLLDVTPIEKGCEFYICGPEAMIKAAAEKAEQYTDAENIIVSLERYMKCGRGVCGSCEAGGLRTCTDGPVFAYNKVRDAAGIYKREKIGRRIELYEY